MVWQKHIQMMTFGLEKTHQLTGGSHEKQICVVFAFILFVWVRASSINIQ